MKKCLMILFAAILAAALCACASPPLEAETPAKPSAPPAAAPKPTPTPTPDPAKVKADYIDSLIGGMSLEQQVAQLFFIRVETADGTAITGAAEATQFAQTAQAGGYVLFAENITNKVDTYALTKALKDASSLPPFVGIDEEGGQVSRLASAGFAGYDPQPPAAGIGKGKDPQQAETAAQAIGQALASIGVNTDFAPVADVLTNPDNTVIGDRAYSGDTQVVSNMASAFQKGLHAEGLLTSPKHFPGHGGTTDDTHTGAAQLDMTQQELQEFNYPPFARLIDEGAEFIMVGHFSVPNADASGLPASLSPYFVTDELRGRLGFTGIAITDSMQMEAITDAYPPADAAVAAILAGGDMILDPEDFAAARDGVITAMQNGEIDEARLREALERILSAKIDAGWIKVEGPLS